MVCASPIESAKTEFFKVCKHLLNTTRLLVGKVGYAALILKKLYFDIVDNFGKEIMGAYRSFDVDNYQLDVRDSEVSELDLKVYLLADHFVNTTCLHK